ncbi:MAG: AraC family transcriptional regulator [Candidatus Methylacidiphilales bacterium]|nr:AraC family transcriptional regulator [Candidatus Methylacidiphilales bacterium]
MDFLIRHWAPLLRRYPSPFPVSTIGYIGRKTEWVRTTFPTCNYSFILSGGGEYRRGGRRWKFAAPAVLMQWPGDPVAYGPADGHESWEELYVVYPGRLVGAFRKMGFVHTDKPIWRIQDVRRLLERCEELQQAMGDGAVEGSADRVDRICESMILDSLLGQSHPEPDPAERAVAAIRQQVRRRLSQEVDWDEVAARQGLSPATFRRRWKQVVRVAPGQYLQSLRIREAKRLLVETRKAVAEVAAACGYGDPLYFSRAFRKETGVTPRDYRKVHRQPEP